LIPTVPHSTRHSLFLSVLVAGAVFVLGCAHRGQEQSEEPERTASFDPAAPVGMPKPKTEAQLRAEATESISFEEDADAGPTEEIKTQPKRKPLPRFRLYGEGPAPSP
jgi:hypothetical protein